MRMFFRVTKDRYARDLSGRGAELYGGRWNSPGRPALYASTSRPLALLETLAWTSMASLLNGGFVLITLECDDHDPGQISGKLPDGWTSVEMYASTRALGDKWLEARKSLLLNVPSAILPMETNVIFNPLHPSAKSIRIAEIYDIVMDPRVVANMQ